MVLGNHKIWLFIIVLLSGLNTCYSQLANKDILNDDLYPKSFVFRFVAEKTQNFSSYEDWEENLVELDGFIGKLFPEEILDFDTVKSANWFNQFANTHPDKFVMVHFNGRARDPRMDNNTLYFAGHWMYHPGTTLTQPITETQTTFTVNDTSVFKFNVGNGSSDKDDDIVIVPLDGSGNRLWDQAEQVTLVSKNGNQIEVIRAQYGTTANSFNAGVYLAPHAVGGPWNNNNLVWLYNYDIDGPVDGNGKRCIDVFSDEVSNWFKPTGLLSDVDGIQFDIARRYVDTRNGRQVDQNNDGIADNQSPVLREKYELGVVQFYQDLRVKIGYEKLIIADGGLLDTQRVVSEINGIEAEGFGDVNDTYKEFSKAVNVFNYFTENSQMPQFSYVTHKDTESVTEEEFRKRERFVLASSQCLGVAFNSFVRNHYPRFPSKNIIIQDELYAGELATPHWLGGPLTDYIDISDNVADVWSGNGLSILMTSTENTFCTITPISETLQVSIDDNVREATITFKDVNVPSGDFVFSFNAQAESNLDVFPAKTPRLIKMEILGGSSYVNDAEEILGFISTDKQYKTSYYIRDIGATTVDVKLTIEGDGNVNLSDFKLRASAQGLARAFDNGVVISNPSLNSLTFDLEQLFPGRSFKRLIATSGHDTVVNNGQDVGAILSVPALDGLFLLDKNHSLSTNNEIELDKEIRIYPNPVDNVLNISVPAKFKKKVLNADLFDVNGRHIFSKKINSSNGNSIELNVLEQGIYTLKISGESFAESHAVIKK